MVSPLSRNRFQEVNMAILFFLNETSLLLQSEFEQ